MWTRRTSLAALLGALPIVRKYLAPSSAIVKIRENYTHAPVLHDDAAGIRVADLSAEQTNADRFTVEPSQFRPV